MAAITGTYLYERYQQKMGQAYTLYFPIPEFNQIIEEALIQAADQRYRNTQDQKFNDELVNLITTNNNIPLINNNMFGLAPIPIYNLTVTGTTWTLTSLLPLNILVGQFVNLSGITGFVTPPNGTQTVTATPTPNSLQFTATTSTGTYNANSGSMYLVSGQLIDYFHVLSIKAYFLDTVYSTAIGQNVITNASNTTPIRITFSDYNNFRSKEQLSISGITGNTNANGTFYMNKVNDLQADLYSDSELQVPVAGNGVFGGNPVISRVYFNYCSRLLPDEKISPLIKASAKNPKYEMADGVIKIYPTDLICSQVTIDYKKRPLNVYGTNLFIDGNDNILDLTQYYNEKFLYNIMDLAEIIGAGQARDSGLTQFETQQLTDNP